MTIKTEADEFDGKQVFTDVKLPGQELHLEAQSIDRIPLGRITLSRVDRLDMTTLSVDAGARGKAIRQWLRINGIEEGINPRKKRVTKTFERANTSFSISPFGNAVCFVDLANNQQYRNLRVTLKASNE